MTAGTDASWGGRCLETLWPEPGTLHERDIPEELSIPSHLAGTASKLEEFARLQSGWNSYGAAPISLSAIKAALRLLVGMDVALCPLVGLNGGFPLPSASPTSRGGVQLEWGGDDEGVEIELHPDGTGSLLIDTNGSSSEYRLQTFAEPALHEALRWIAKLV